MKPMRCRQCKERFWVQNPSSYVAAGAIAGGVLLFLGLVWLVVMHATRSQDTILLAPTVAGTPADYSQPPARQDDADIRAADADTPTTKPGSGAPAKSDVEAAPAQADTGLKMPDDRAITVQWYRENAEKGDLDAQYKLGLLHLTGKGALQDFGEAAKWLKLSAEQGHPQAQFQLGLIYRVGHGVPIDPGQAYKWLNLAAAAGVNQAVLVRNEVMRSLSTDQLAQAQKASREWQATRPKPVKANSGGASNAASDTPPGEREAKAVLSNDGAAGSSAGSAPAASKN
jgi:TPR repeat protein